MSQWVKCTSHDTGEVYYLNLIHVVAMWTTAWKRLIPNSAKVYLKAVMCGDD